MRGLTCELAPGFVLTIERGRNAYAQAVSQIRRGIVDRRLRVGDRLPAILTVAADLDLSPVTVQHIYSALQREGLTSASPKGTVITEPSRESIKLALLEDVDALLARMVQRGLTFAEIREVVTTSISAWTHSP